MRASGKLSEPSAALDQISSTSPCGGDPGAASTELRNSDETSSHLRAGRYWKPRGEMWLDRKPERRRLHRNGLHSPHLAHCTPLILCADMLEDRVGEDDIELAICVPGQIPRVPLHESKPIGGRAALWNFEIDDSEIEHGFGCVAERPRGSPEGFAPADVEDADRWGEPAGQLSEQVGAPSPESTGPGIGSRIVRSSPKEAGPSRPGRVAGCRVAIPQPHGRAR